MSFFSGIGGWLQKLYFVKLLFNILGWVWGVCIWPKRQISPYWHKLSHFWRNIVVGILIGILIHFGHGTPWVQSAEDAALDWMNQLQVDTLHLAPENPEDGYTFIDMDEAAYLAYGEPYHVPRDKLLQLIKYAADGGAQSIIVDIDLTLPGTDPEADQELVEYLANYPEIAPDLVLLRTYKPQQRSDQSLAKVRNIFFDKKINSPSIHWAQPHFLQDRVDQTIRRWRLIEASCFEGSPNWLPSPQLLVTLLETEGREGWTKLAKKLKSTLPADCTGKTDLQHAKGGSFKLAQNKIDFNTYGVQQRVLFSYSMKQPPLGNTLLGYNRLPAGLITESKVPPTSEDMQGQHVVIGTSYQAGHDIHHTPVGSMPGALVIINAIKSLRQHGQLNGPPDGIKFLLEAVLIVLMALAFEFYSKKPLKTLLICISFVLVLVPVSFFLFRYGIWLDLAAPILGMQLHQVIADYENMAALKEELQRYKGEEQSETTS